MDHHNTATDRFRLTAFFDGAGDPAADQPHDPYLYFLITVIRRGLNDISLRGPDDPEVWDWIDWFLGHERSRCHAIDTDDCPFLTFAEVSEYLGIDRDAALSELTDKLRKEPCQMSLILTPSPQTP